MKILVIDDSPVHQKSAHQAFSEHHDLTVAGSHDEALELLWKEEWDVVLSDLLMPAGRYAQGPKGEEYVGQEMPVGWSLAITAALYGAEYVAVFTDINHHYHPASAMLDDMSKEVFSINSARALFTNNIFVPDRRGNEVGIEGTEKTCEKCGGSGGNRKANPCFTCKGTGTDYTQKGKNWAGVLEALMEE